MDIFVFSLVIFSTFCHAYWNMVLKKTSGGFFFIWLFTLMTTVFYIPYIISQLGTLYENMNLQILIVGIISMVLHLMYFVFLDQAYKYGELSIIYPVARGIAPVFTIVAAFLFLNERLLVHQILSIALILGGTFILSSTGAKTNQRLRASLIYALICGLMVAGYTIIDKIAVSSYGISPFLLDFANNVGRVFLLLPFVIKDHPKLKNTVRQYWKEAIVVALLSPLSYVLVLFAMKSAPVSLIAPLRQFSIVISVC